MAKRRKKVVRKRKKRKKTPKPGCVLNDEQRAVLSDSNAIVNQGFDFGVKPRVVSICNLDFIRLWGEAKCCALGYTFNSKTGLFDEIPEISIGFQKKGAARKFFEILTEWMKPPCDDSAIDICFVEDEENQDYYFCLSVDMKQLELRTLGKNAEKDFDVLCINGGISHIFKISDYYQHFKSSVQKTQRAYVTYYIIRDVQKYHDRESYAALAPVETNERFLKRGIRFCDKKALLPETLEYALINRARSSDVKPPAFRETPLEVEQRRSQQMQRFFPVTLTRLLFNQSFLKAKTVLASKYLEWQVKQAACNLIAIKRFGKTGTQKNNMIEIYHELLKFLEEPNDELSLEHNFEETVLEQQIQYDMMYLHSLVVNSDSKADIVHELRSRGFVK